MKRNLAPLASLTLFLASSPADSATIPPAVSDEDWMRIAESQLDQTYTIAKGDTLYDISKKLFGDANYWPKIWAINGRKIPNPHLIYPSNTLVFSPGGPDSLPSLEVRESLAADSSQADAAATGDAMSDSPVRRARPRKLRSQEWRDLPPQPWEEVQVSLPETVDDQGFDLSTRYLFPPTRGMELPWWSASDPIDSLGTITGSRDENKFLTTGDWIYVRDNGRDLPTDTTFVITTAPSVLKASFFGRKGYAYPILGKVRIVGKKNGLWIGRIESARASIERDSCFLIPDVARVDVPAPVAAPEPIEATFIVERGSEVAFSSQHKIAFIDRGTNDGLTPGMVLRSYQSRDPYDGRRLTRADVIVAGDVQVLQASERFSTVLVIRSPGQIIDHGTRLTALTDVADLEKQKVNLARDVDAPEESTNETDGVPAPSEEGAAPDAEAENDLDQLETSDELTDEEKKSLDQLEKTKDEGTSEQVPGDVQSEPRTEDSKSEPETVPSADEEEGPPMDLSEDAPEDEAVPDMGESSEDSEP